MNSSGPLASLQRMKGREFHRRSFLKSLSLALPLATAGPVLVAAQSSVTRDTPRVTKRSNTRELMADVVIIGGGTGGCAAALAAARHGLRVIMTEETDWIGGDRKSVV